MAERIVPIIDSIKRAFAQKNLVELRAIGNNAIKEAALENSKILAEISLIAYCLHKLSTKEHVVKSPKWISVRKIILDSLEHGIQSIKRNNSNDFLKELETIIKSIDKFDSDLSHFIHGLYEKARVKNASEAYSYGMSLSQAADLTGASKEQVLNYIGATTTHDEHFVTFGIFERLERLKKLV